MKKLKGRKPKTKTGEVKACNRQEVEAKKPNNYSLQSGSFKSWKAPDLQSSWFSLPMYCAFSVLVNGQIKEKHGIHVQVGLLRHAPPRKNPPWEGKGVHHKGFLFP